MERQSMGSLSIWHWLIFLVVALLLFGGSGKISSIMGDVAKGIKSFKKGMTEDDTAAAPTPQPPAPDPFKKDEPRALNRAAAGSAQTPPAGQPGASQTAPQVNKVS
jgi:sec-independent protein translocase protein TatA